jgi:hypothetical protein
MPLEKLGRRGVELLADRPDTRIEEVIEGPIELIVRESAAKVDRASNTNGAAPQRRKRRR